MKEEDLKRRELAEKLAKEWKDKIHSFADNNKIDITNKKFRDISRKAFKKEFENEN